MIRSIWGSEARYAKASSPPFATLVVSPNGFRAQRIDAETEGSSSTTSIFSLCVMLGNQRNGIRCGIGYSMTGKKQHVLRMTRVGLLVCRRFCLAHGEDRPSFSGSRLACWSWLAPQTKFGLGNSGRAGLHA